MPKNDQAQKPIYIPRNIYVPVIRPVFVPRERIIVRPQIIHVARPVLVDRPVPIQQRPIVIERDRPVPVRVETIEKNEGAGNCSGDLTRNVETAQEVTYHEFTQQSSYNQYQDDFEDARRKQEVMSMLDEAERKKLNLQSKSNEDLVAQYKYVKYDSGADNVRTLDSLIGNSQGYTLEVLDQRVSDKFEKTDQETIKARYGVDSYQYLPQGVELKGAGSSYVINNSEYYPNNSSNNNQTSNLRASGSFKSLSSANELRNNNSSSNIFQNYASGADSSYGNAAQTSPGSRAGSQGSIVIQNVQKMMSNAYNPYEQSNPGSSLDN